MSNAAKDLFRKGSGGGGGYLHGTAGEIVSLAFGEPKEFTSAKGKPYHKLSMVVNILADGAEEPKAQYLDAGMVFPDNTTIEGATITSDRAGSPPLQSDTDFYLFVESAIEGGFPVEKLSINDFSGLAGWRYEFKREQNLEKQMAAGKKKLGVKAKNATEEEILAAGKRVDPKDKTKSYNQDRLLVAEVLGEVEGRSVAKKAAPKASVKPVAAAKPAVEVDVDTDYVDAAVQDILANAKGGVVKRGNLSTELLKWQQRTKPKASNETRNTVYGVAKETTYIVEAAERGIFNYDEDAKTLSSVGE